MSRVDVASLSQQTPFGTLPEPVFCALHVHLRECFSVGDK